MPETKAPKCAFCAAPKPEKIEISVSLAKGLPFDAIRVFACKTCSPKGFAQATAQLKSAVDDLPRRRAILKLNDEYQALLVKKAPSAALDANRAAKTELVLMGKKDLKALREALALVEG
jgi:hypothetical protein